MSADPTQVANSNTVAANLLIHLQEVETWITNNSPNGAALTPAQTLKMMRGLAGLIRFLMGVWDSASST